MGSWDYLVKKKSNAPISFMNFPLLLPLISLLPTGFKDVRIQVPITTYTVAHKDGNWAQTGRTIECPVYDHEVVTHMIYILCVSMIMSYTAFINWKHYPPADTTGVTLCKKIGELSDDGFVNDSD